jgi:hypothetical protein
MIYPMPAVLYPPVTLRAVRASANNGTYSLRCYFSHAKTGPETPSFCSIIMCILQGFTTYNFLVTFAYNFTQSPATALDCISKMLTTSQMCLHLPQAARHHIEYDPINTASPSIAVICLGKFILILKMLQKIGEWFYKL